MPAAVVEHGLSGLQAGHDCLESFLLSNSLQSIRKDIRKLHHGKKPDRCGKFAAEGHQVGACGQCVEYMSVLGSSAKRRPCLRALYGKKLNRFTLL